MVYFKYWLCKEKKKLQCLNHKTFNIKKIAIVFKRFIVKFIIMTYIYFFNFSETYMRNFADSQISSKPKCMTYHPVYNKSNTTGATRGAEAAYPSGGSVLTHCFYWESCCSIFSFPCNVLQIIVCLVVPFLFVILRFTASDYTFWYLQTFQNDLELLSRIHSQLRCFHILLSFRRVLTTLLFIVQQIGEIVNRINTFEVNIINHM